MNKNEFFTSLNNKLSILNEKERRDITDEYVSHINLKMGDGKTEEQAVADFGDIDDLAREILEAYHIDNAAAQTKTLEYYVKAGVNFINQATENLLNFSPSAIARVMVEFLFVIVIIFIISLPINMLGDNIRYYMSAPFLSVVAGILTGIIELVKISIGFLITYGFIKTRILSRGSNMNNPNGSSDWQNNRAHASGFVPHNTPSEKHSTECANAVADTIETVDAENVEATSSNKNVNCSQSYSGSENDYSRSYYINENTYSQGSSSDKKQSNYKDVNESKEQKHFNGGDFVTNLVVIVLKISLFFIAWLPAALITITSIICTVLTCMIFAIKGVGFLGLCIICIGCSLMGISFTAWVGKVIFGGKKKNA